MVPKNTCRVWWSTEGRTDRGLGLVLKMERPAFLRTLTVGELTEGGRGGGLEGSERGMFFFSSSSSNWKDRDWWTGAAFAHSLLRKAVDCILTDRWSAVSSAALHLIRPILLLLLTAHWIASRRVSFCFFSFLFNLSIFIPSLLVTYECVSVKILLHKHLENGGADRPMCPNPLAYE